MNLFCILEGEPILVAITGECDVPSHVHRLQGWLKQRPPSAGCSCWCARRSTVLKN
jgi:hypothetical protein